VIDNGTGYTKMGYAGNLDPSYLIPSTIAYSLNKVSLLLLSIFYRKIQNLTTMRWIIILARKL
jgi:actin-related protein